MSFINPVKNSEIKKKFLSKNVKILSTKYNIVFCPYDGEIVEYKPDECGGKLKIKHEINKTQIFSVFCNIVEVPMTLQYPGTEVSKNSKIGKINGDTLEYSIEDYYERNLDVLDYIKKEVKCDKNEFYNEVTNKCETKKTTPDGGKNYESGEVKNYDSSDIKTDPITSLLLRGMLSPFEAASNILDPKKRKEEKEKRQKEKEEEKKKKEEEKMRKKKEEEENKLTEEITRIKQLLK